MILIAGASGAVGFECLRLARKWGAPIRTLSRSQQNAERLKKSATEVVVADASLPGALSAICRGVHTVVSCLGAPVDPGAPDKQSFRDIDTAANLALLDEAREHGVRRIVYVSVYLQAAYSRTAYVKAHEEVVRRIRESGLDYTIVRPTGIFSAFAAMLDVARKGVLPRIGDGSARTNPIHPADVAAAVSRHIAEGPRDVSVGGPETFTRAQIAHLVFHALGKSPRIIGVPSAMVRLSADAMKRWNPRMAELTEFLIEASTHDCIAPVAGKKKLLDYLRSRA